MGKTVDRQRYLRNCATSLQGQLGLSAEQFKGLKTFAEIEDALNARAASIDIRLMQSPDEQVGKLACIASEADVRQLARQALVPAVASKIWAQLNPKRVITCRFCDFTISKFARGRPGTAFDVMRDHIDEEHPDEAKEIVASIYGSRDARDEADAEVLASE